MNIVNQDLSTRYDWPDKNVIVYLPISLLQERREERCVTTLKTAV